MSADYHRTANLARPTIAIVGAGFGGLELAQRLRKQPVDVVLVDRNNYHTFQPLLYQVATAGLEPGDIAHSVRHILQRVRNCKFVLGSATDVDWDRRRLHVDVGDGSEDRSIAFDYLVLAAGAVNADFGVPGVAEHSFPMKDLDDAVRLRNHILKQFERADADPATIANGVLNFVVVGGGPTGVETAGALRELFGLVLRKDFPGLAVERARVILVEQAEELLTAYASRLRSYGVRALERLGAEVRLGQSVVRAAPGFVELSGNEVIKTETLIWAAGVRANPLAEALRLPQASGGRVVVDPDLRVPGNERVFVIGDMAATTDANGDLLPQVAAIAIQAGRHVAKQIERLRAGQPTTAFVYKELGQMATIGRHAAVVELPGGGTMKGVLAWMAWLLLHLVKIIGFRDKATVFINWVYNYFTYDRSARMIFGTPPLEAKRLSDNDPVKVSDVGRV